MRVVKLLFLGKLHRDVKSWEIGEYSNDILERSSEMFTVHTRQQMAEMVMRWSMFSAYSSFFFWPLCPASLTNINRQRCKIIHGMHPVGLKDRLIDRHVDL